MKKVFFIFFLIIIYVIILTKKIDQAFIERIDLNLKENEVGITFLPLEYSNSLLINKGQTKILLVLEYLNNSKIHDVLELFNVKRIDYLLMNTPYEIELKTAKEVIIANKEVEIDDIKFSSNNNGIEIEYLDHHFCVYEKANPTKMVGNCNYVYFLNVNKDVSINEETNMIFYNEGTNNDFLEPVYDQWVDIYVVKKQYYVTLKLDEDTYDTITLPLVK